MKTLIFFLLATTAIAGGLITFGPGPGSKMGGFLSGCVTQGTTDGAANFTDNTGYVCAGKPITLSSGKTISTVRVLLDTGSVSITGGLYSSSGGAPDARLTFGAAQAAVTGWNTIQVTPVAVAAGTYWVAFQTNTSASSSIKYTSPSTGPNCVVSHVYDGTLPDPYGACGGGFDWNTTVVACP